MEPTSINEPPTRISVTEVKRIMDRGEPVFFIDTRNPTAWGESGVKIKGAVRIHYKELESHLAELPHDRTIVTYCT